MRIRTSKKELVYHGYLKVRIHHWWRKQKRKLLPLFKTINNEFD